MKTRILLPLVVSLLPLIARAQMALGPTDVQIEKILPAIVKSPEYQLVGGETKRFKNLGWLEVEVEFQTRPEVIDELTFHYVIQFNGKLLTGDVTHVSIAKGRDHYSVAYVSPKALDRFMEGRAVTANSIENILVEVSRQGQKLAVKSFRPTPLPNVPQLSGSVLQKAETPFAPLYWDRYEAVKVPAR